MLSFHNRGIISRTSTSFQFHSNKQQRGRSCVCYRQWKYFTRLVCVHKMTWNDQNLLLVLPPFDFCLNFYIYLLIVLRFVWTFSYFLFFFVLHYFCFVSVPSLSVIFAFRELFVSTYQFLQSVLILSNFFHYFFGFITTGMLRLNFRQSRVSKVYWDFESMNFSSCLITVLFDFGSIGEGWWGM